MRSASICAASRRGTVIAPIRGTAAKYALNTASQAAFYAPVGHLTLEETLRNHAFMHGLAERHIARLAALATEVTFAEDEVILEDRQQSRYFYLVTAGSVTVELHTSILTVTVLTLGPGQAFGWSALLDHQETVFQVRARERTAALRIAGPDLTWACRDDGGLGVEMLLRTLQVAAGRIKATEAKFAEMCGVRIHLSTKNEHSPI